jgi:hypothetical protein
VTLPPILQGFGKSDDDLVLHIFPDRCSAASAGRDARPFDPGRRRGGIEDDNSIPIGYQPSLTANEHCH